MLARDRRKRKSRIKAVIFFIAICSIALGVFLRLNDSASDKAETMAYPLHLDSSMTNDLTSSTNQFQDILADALYPASAYTTSFANETLQSSQILADTRGLNTEDNNATSYEDDLGQDDEAEEVTTHDEFDGLEGLPNDAKDVVANILDVADQAIRIKEQFSHTVVKGETLKDVLELLKH